MFKTLSLVLALVGVIASQTEASAARSKAQQAAMVFRMKNDVVNGMVIPRYVPGSLAERRNDARIKRAISGWR